MPSVTEIQVLLKRNYPRLGTIRKIESIKHNDINSKNFVIHTNRRKFVLHYFTPDNFNAEKTEKICKILTFCVKHKARVPQPIKTVTGKYVDKKERTYLTSFHIGATYGSSKEELNNFAKNLALIHKILKKSKIIYNYQNNPQSYRILTPHEFTKIQKIITKKSTKNFYDNIILKYMNDLLKTALHDHKISKEISKLGFKKQLIHNDLHPSNVIFYKKKVSAIVDFNFMRKGVIIEDIAFTSFRFALFSSSNVQKIQLHIKQFIKMYSLFNKINDEQLHYFDYYLKHILLGRISYILRKRYFHNSNLWINVLQDNLKLLKFAMKINPMK